MSVFEAEDDLPPASTFHLVSRNLAFPIFSGRRSLPVQGDAKVLT